LNADSNIQKFLDNEEGSIMSAAILLIVSLAVAMLCYICFSPVITIFHGYLQDIPTSNLFLSNWARNNIDIAFGYGWRLVIMIGLPVASAINLIVEIHRSQTSSNTGTRHYQEEWEQW